MKRIYIKEDTSIDWRSDYDVYAISTFDKLFHRKSDICGNDNLVINLNENFCNTHVVERIDEEEVSDIIQNIEFSSNNTIEFLLYSQFNRLVGFVEKYDGFGL